MKLAILTLMPLLLAGCAVKNHYYQNPMHGSMTPYRPMPMIGDSVRTATYFDGAAFLGKANESSDQNLFGVNTGSDRDKFYGVYAGMHRAHAFVDAHVFYGANVAFGGYKVNDAHVLSWQYPYNNGNPVEVTGKNTYGFFTAGFYGGANVTKKYKNAEWRIIGAEFSYQQEWGGYADFRKRLDPEEVMLVDQRTYYPAITLTTEAIGKTSYGTSGWKLAFGWSTRKIPYDVPYSESKRLPWHMSNTIHYGWRRNTAYFQFNCGYYMMNLQTGMNFRIGS